MLSKTFLVYGKFLEPNAYIYVDCVTKETREKLIEVVNKGMSSENDINPENAAEIHSTKMYLI